MVVELIVTTIDYKVVGNTQEKQYYFESLRLLYYGEMKKKGKGIYIYMNFLVWKSVNAELPP